MDRSNREHHSHRDHREHRDSKEPPTMAFHMKTWKTINKPLRAFAKLLRENTTVTFTPQPAIIIQSAKNHLVLKLIIHAECLYITDTDHFSTKTINNFVPLFDSFMGIISNPDVTKLYIQHDSDLYTRFLVTASDICAQASIPCVNGQEIVRESGKSALRIDLDHSTVTEILKWLAPVTKNKRSNKNEMTLAQIVVQVNPPSIKFLTDLNEIEFAHSGKVVFHDAKCMRLELSSKNLQQAFSTCAVLKSSCSLRAIAGKEYKLFLIAKNVFLTVEAYLSQEQVKDDPKFERQAKTEEKGEKNHKVEEGNNFFCKQETQHKITSYMVPTKNGGTGTNFFNEKEDSESDDSAHFDYTPNSKRQRCGM